MTNANDALVNSVSVFLGNGDGTSSPDAIRTSDKVPLRLQLATWTAMESSTSS